MPKNLKDRIEDVLTVNGQGLVTEIQNELKDQGHFNTGSLHDSIQATVSRNSEGLDLDILMSDYHVYVEKGVRASRIPYGGRKKTKGSGTSKYIQGLIGYFQSKGLDTKEATRAAFATANVHKKQGMPTAASKQYSKNGRRLKFIDESTAASKQIESIDSQILDEMEIEIMTMLDEIDKTLPK